MGNFLKKIKSENFRLRYLKFSELDSFCVLSNYTRIKSFILKDECEISCSKWYSLYFNVINYLQKSRPVDLSRLLELPPIYGRCKPFSDCYKSGYRSTKFDLYLRNQGTVNSVVHSIRYMLKVYGVDPNSAYLVVELTPNAAERDCDEIIDYQKQELYKFLLNFRETDKYYDFALKAIDALNASLKYFSNTTYNNLYLLDETDYDAYATKAVNKQLSKPENTFTENELLCSTYWLRRSRFYEGDYINLEHKDKGECYIEDDDSLIKVTFKTHFVEDVNHE